MSDIDDLLAKLDERLVMGEITEETYKELRNRLLSDKSSNKNNAPRQNVNIGSDSVAQIYQNVDSHDTTNIGQQFSGQTTINQYVSHYGEVQDFEDLLRQGLLHLENRNFGNALRVFSNLITRFPERNESKFCMAIAIPSGNPIESLSKSNIDSIVSLLRQSGSSKRLKCVSLLYMAIIHFDYYRKNGLAEPTPDFNTIKKWLSLNKRDNEYSNLIGLLNCSARCKYQLDLKG